MAYLRIFIFFCCLSFLPLQSLQICGPHTLSIGPEAYYMKRGKKGGSWQDGHLIGFRATYDRLARCGLYMALDGYWATGSLEGESKSGRTLKSDVTEYQTEGRLGFSYTFPQCKRVTWVAYGGYGYFESDNEFVYPSPMIYHSIAQFKYYAGGGMVFVTINDSMDAGFHFKYKFPDEPKCIIDEDPDWGKLTQIMGRENQYEAELPFRYQKCCYGRRLGIQLTPFYRFRHYGQYENFPFDCFDTRFHIWGARLQFQVVL